jgi:hypothetical protein
MKGLQQNSNAMPAGTTTQRCSNRNYYIISVSSYIWVADTEGRHLSFPYLITFVF